MYSRIVKHNNENLPVQLVLYPGAGGTIFGFKKDSIYDTKIFLCSCSIVAIENYIKLRTFKTSITDSKEIEFGDCFRSSFFYKNAKPHVKFILSSRDFPYELVDNLININAPSNEKIIEHLNFAENICHECNQIVPKYKYCVEMYGGVFKQNFGWYINKQAYEYGINGTNKIYNNIINEICPQEILDLIEIDPENTFKKIIEYRRKRGQEKDEKLSASLWEKEYELDKKLRKQNRKIWNIAENEVRRKIGFKKIGEAWTSETILYYMIKKMYPLMTIIRHYRPDYLKGLEIDIFIKELSIGIEYQGIQHYKPIKHWGGVKALEKLKIRDKNKKDLCKNNDIKLVCFKHDEGLSDDYIKNKLEGLWNFS